MEKRNSDSESVFFGFIIDQAEEFLKVCINLWTRPEMYEMGIEVVV